MLKDVVLRLRALFFRSRMDGELREELDFHIEMQARKHRQQDLDPAEAKRQARLRFGSMVAATEECREQRGISFIESLAKDMRFGLRVLRKSPAFAAVAAASLALAIGANAVVFAALNAVILRPLNVPDAERLYSIHRATDNSAYQSYPDYLDFRDRNRSFKDLAAYNIVQAGLDTGESPSRAWLLAVSGNYFDVLGIRPHLGRFFSGSDERGANSAPYIVLSHAYWHSRFHDDPGVVGRVVQLNKHPFTIVGVAPPGFHGTLMFFNPDFFVPIVNQEQLQGVSVLNARSNRSIFMVMGHLKPGVTAEQAAADINAVSAYLEKTYPKEHEPMTFALARPSLYGEFLGRPARAFLTALMLLAGLILLAACANLGSLFAARAADRSREIAMRLALGAGRMRIIRQLLTEAILISLLGGAVGLWGSVVLLRWLSAWNPMPQFPINLPLSPDATVYGVAFLLTLASGFLFAAVPVRQVLRTDPYEIVKSGSRRTTGKRLSGRDLLVVAQITICAVLVTSSIVAVRGLIRSMEGDYGFEPRNALLVETILDMAGYRGDAVPVMQKRMIDEVGAIPGVTAVGSVNWAPLSNGSLRTSFVYTDETADLKAANAAATAANLKVSPNYFRAAGTALLSGRDFAWHDDLDAPRVAVVNLEFARRIFGSANNVTGRYYKLGNGSRIQVVGMVEQGKYRSLTEDPIPAMFLPVLQWPDSETVMVVRSEGDPQQLAAVLRSKLRDLDAGLPSYIQTWDQGLNLVLFPPRVATVVLGVLGLMAVMLSVTGIFGLAAYSVSTKLRELGIRMALGAQRREILQAALGRPFKLLALGSAAGVLLGITASGVLGFVVYQATPRDPLVLAGVVLVMFLLWLLATWIPAQRAVSVDPVILLRED